MRHATSFPLVLPVLTLALLVPSVTWADDPLPASPAAPAAAPATPATTGTPRLEFEKVVLPNGLQLILHVDRRLPVVHVNQWFHVGSKNERPGRTGFAHLFEHMMFQGSKHAEGEYFTYAEKVGANLKAGGVNGTTDRDRTNYFITAPSGSLEYLLWLESDRLATLTDVLTPEKLDNQREVVRNERRLGVDNRPYGRAYIMMSELLFPAGHPYSWPVIGSHEDLEAATPDDVKEFFQRYYTPSNLTLTIAGDFDPAEAKQLVQKYFGSIPPGPALERPRRMPVALAAPVRVDVADRVPQERLYLVWPSPAWFEPGDADLDLAALILGDGLSSRLQRALIYDRQLVTDITVYNSSLEVGGQFILWATLRPGASADEVERLIDAEIHRFSQEGPTEAELSRAKNKYEYQFVTNLEKIGGFGGKADRLAMYNTYLGDPGKLGDDLARYRAATPASVKDATARILDTDRRLAMRFYPQNPQIPADAGPDRAVTPVLKKDRPFLVPEVTQFTLPSGLEVFVVSRRDLPRVAAAVYFKAGAADVPREKAGLAKLISVMLDKGTPSRKALEIEDAFADLGTSFGSQAGSESISASFSALSRDLDRGLDLLADILQHATYPDEELERERKRLLDEISQEKQDANSLAARLLPALVFGAEHPYGIPVTGDEAGVTRVTAADLKSFHRAKLQAGNAALVLAGDVDPATVKALVETRFGAWEGKKVPAREIPPARPAGWDKVYLVDRPDSAQSVMMIGMPGIPRGSEDYHTVELVNAVWAGSFMSRLNLNLREDKGISYGVFGNPMYRTAAGWWQAGGSIQTQGTKTGLQELDRELVDLTGTLPITALELDAAKANRIRGYSQAFESLEDVSRRIGTLWVQGRPLTDLASEPELLGKATLEAVQQAAKKHVKPETAFLLVIGDRNRIEKEIREAGVGDIVPLDVTGSPEGKK